MEDLSVQKRREALAIAARVKRLIRQYGHSSTAPSSAILQIQDLLRKMLHCISIVRAFETLPFNQAVLDHVSSTYSRVLALSVPRPAAEKEEDVVPEDGSDCGHLGGCAGKPPCSTAAAYDSHGCVAAVNSTVDNPDSEDESNHATLDRQDSESQRTATDAPRCTDRALCADAPPGDSESNTGKSNPFQECLRSGDAIKVRWNDVSGCCEAVTALKQAVVLPHSHPHLFTASRQPWRAILLYGPPGTGKTTLAAAAAAEAHAELLSVSAADLLSKWVGDSEKLVRQLFHYAATLPRCIIFFDEVDALAGLRGGSTETEASRRIKTELLVSMLALGSETRHSDGRMTTLIAATNLPWELDPAFRRRFDRYVFVGLPDAAARKELLHRHLKGVDHCISQDDVKQLADATEGYSACDVVRVVQHAVLLPVTKLLNATHFRKERVGSSSESWVPCESTHPDAVAITLNDLPPLAVKLSTVSLDHVRDSLNRTPPTTSSEMIKKYAEWEKSLRE